MNTQEREKQVAIAFALFVKDNCIRTHNGWLLGGITAVYNIDQVWDKFIIQSELFKSIPKPETSIPVSVVQKRID